MCCASVGLDNKLYKMHSTYIKIRNRKSASIKIIT